MSDLSERPGNVAGPPRMWPIRRALTTAFAAAVVLVIASWFLVSWLLGFPGRQSSRPLDTAAQLDLLKLTFAVVAGIGAVVALVTAYRRQRVDEAAGERAERAHAHAERIQDHAERVATAAAHDATERRVTDLYGQAVEQLGHDKAAVRLGGLYALERLAHGYPDHRQTVTDVVCAYLRMPFDPAEDQNRNEIQVRLAAQRLLSRHLAVPQDAGDDEPAAHWPGLGIDLTGAHLVDLDLSRCQVRRLILTDARFTGNAWFTGSRFAGNVTFAGAHFTGNARFSGAAFEGNVTFGGVGFDGTAWFDTAAFAGNARFDDVRFAKGAWFNRASFQATAWYGGAVFAGHTTFGGAVFAGTARFHGAGFTSPPEFGQATASHPNDHHVWPPPWHTEPPPDGEPMAALTSQD